jgi:hypothetical protein
MPLKARGLRVGDDVSASADARYGHRARHRVQNQAAFRTWAGDALCTTAGRCRPTERRIRNDCLRGPDGMVLRSDGSRERMGSHWRQAATLRIGYQQQSPSCRCATAIWTLASIHFVSAGPRLPRPIHHCPPNSPFIRRLCPPVPAVCRAGQTSMLTLVSGRAPRAQPHHESSRRPYSSRPTRTESR